MTKRRTSNCEKKTYVKCMSKWIKKEPGQENKNENDKCMSKG